MINGVLFDMDGTILDTEQLSFHSWQKAGCQMGVNITPQIFDTLIGKNPITVNEILRQQLGENLDITLLRSLHEKEYKKLIAYGVPIKKGLPSLISYLKEQNIPRAIATSTERKRAEITLQKSEVKDDFSAIIYGDDITESKPSPDIFLAAAEAISVPSNECLIIEDSTAGILAGKASGGYVIYIPDLQIVPAYVKNGIAAQMDDLSQVIDWIKQKNQDTNNMK